MRLLKNGPIFLCAAVLLACACRPAGAVTKTFTAKVSYASTAVVGKPPEPAPAPPLSLPIPPDATVFMDSYGFTWADYRLLRQTGTVIIADSRTQFMNFLASNLQPDNGRASLKVVCAVGASPPAGCGQLLAPGDGQNKTIYLGINVLVKNNAQGGSAALILADSSPSFDVTIVYQ